MGMHEDNIGPIPALIKNYFAKPINVKKELYMLKLRKFNSPKTLMDIYTIDILHATKINQG